MSLPPRLRDIMSRVINKLFIKPKRCTIQLYHNDRPEWEKSPLEPIGCGVMVEIEDSYFIITAAHVILDYALKRKRNPYRDEDDYDFPEDAYLSLNNVGFINNQAFYPIQRVIFTNTERGTIENNVDLAILILDKESAQELKQKFQFLSNVDILLNHKVTTESRYHIFGYPAEWTDLDPSNGLIKSKPFQFVTKCIPNNEGSIGYNKRFNLLVSYDRTKMVYTSNGKSIEAFSPKGISGCGIWYYSGKTDMKLIGIMIEDKWVKDQQPLMMATKIDEALNIIYSYLLRKQNTEK